MSVVNFSSPIRSAERCIEPFSITPYSFSDNLYTQEEDGSILIPGTGYRYFLDAKETVTLSKRETLEQAHEKGGITLDFFLPKPGGTQPVVHTLAELDYRKMSPEEWHSLIYIEYRFLENKKIYARTVSNSFRNFCTQYKTLREGISKIGKDLQEADFGALKAWNYFTHHLPLPYQNFALTPDTSDSSPDISTNSNRSSANGQSIICIPYRVVDKESTAKLQAELTATQTKATLLEKERVTLLAQIRSLQKEKSQESVVPVLPAVLAVESVSENLTEESTLESTPLQKTPEWTLVTGKNYSEQQKIDSFSEQELIHEATLSKTKAPTISETVGEKTVNTTVKQAKKKKKATKNSSKKVATPRADENAVLEKALADAAEETMQLSFEQLEEALSIRAGTNPRYNNTVCSLMEPHDGAQCGCKKIVDLVKKYPKNTCCIFLLGEHLASGRGIEQNEQEGLALLQKAKKLYSKEITYTE